MTLVSLKKMLGDGHKMTHRDITDKGYLFIYLSRNGNVYDDQDRYVSSIYNIHIIFWEGYFECDWEIYADEPKYMKNRDVIQCDFVSTLSKRERYQVHLKELSLDDTPHRAISRFINSNTGELKRRNDDDDQVPI